MSKPAEHPEVRELEDLAWSVKDTVADFYHRALSANDKATLASAQRDLERIKDRLVGLRDKRKRSGNGAVETVALDTPLLDAAETDARQGADP